MTTEPCLPPADGLDDIDRALVAALASGKTATEAAAALALSVTTVYRRGRRPTFKVALTEARAGQFAPVAGRLVQLLPEACDALADVLRDKDARPADRLKAVGTVFDGAMKFAEQVDVRTALADVQARLAEVEAAGASAPDTDNTNTFGTPAPAPDGDSDPTTPTGGSTRDD